MEVLRRMMLGLMSALFIVLLFATAVDFGFVKTFSNRVTVKKVLNGSGVYSSAVSSALDQIKTVKTNELEISLSDPAVRKAAEGVLTPQYLQMNINGAIDGVYDWLEGKTVTPGFTVNFASPKAVFATDVAKIARQKLEVAPVCSPGQVPDNLYNPTCRPANVIPAVEEQFIRNNIVENADFLGDSVITPNDFKEPNNQPFFQQQNVKEIPKQYQRAKRTPLYLAVFTVLVATAIIFLSKSRRLGLRHIGVDLLIVGGLMLAFAWGINKVVTEQAVPKIKVDNAILQQNVRSLVTDLTHQVDKNYWYFGGGYVILGLACTATGIILLRRRQPSEVIAPHHSPEHKEEKDADKKTSDD